MNKKKQLVWFSTADLRVADNTALYHASQIGPCIGVFVVTPEQYTQHDDALIKQDFWFRHLLELSQQLTALNIPLKVIIKKKYADIPKALLSIAKEHKVSQLHFNQQYPVNERIVQTKLKKLFALNKLEVHDYIDQVIFEPGSILTGQGNFYTVFTPFKKNFLKTLATRRLQVYPVPKKQSAMNISSDSIKPWYQQAKFRNDLWPVGEQKALKRLKLFAKNKVNDYKNTRDIPSIHGTSTLSPYIAAGVLSIRQCFQALQEYSELENSEGAATWQSELIWREFYKHILIGFPQVSRHQPFKEKTKQIIWNNNPEHLSAWQAGMTGIPIVDAAMRQLKQTGWMHNRLRMVTAMFLSKNLFLDWRLGEKYFMQQLIDGDIAANNGGWQWSASTGTDAAPYFRVFNPLSQSQRFDPEGKFIRKFIPELIECDNKTIHNPWDSKQTPKNLNYPKPIVDLKETRKIAIERFKNLTG